MGFFTFVCRRANMSARVYSKTAKSPRRPFEKERLDAELKLLGEYGLKNKREVWRVNLQVAKMRKAARELLTLDEHDPKRIFEGAALLRRLHNYGILPENQNQLDYVLGLTVNNLLERRLQTLVLNLVLQNLFIKHVYSSDKDTFVLENNWLIFLLSWSVLKTKTLLILLTPLHLVEVDLDVLQENVQTKIRVMMMIC